MFCLRMSRIVCTIRDMIKHLTDIDIENMAHAPFVPDARAVRRSVREKLRLGQLIPPAAAPVPTHATLDLHNRTEQESWDLIMAMATSGVRHAKIITGASGILKIKFQQWVRTSILAPYIAECTPINNGSFDVKFHKLRGNL